MEPEEENGFARFSLHQQNEYLCTFQITLKLRDDRIFLHFWGKGNQKQGGGKQGIRNQ